MAQIDACEQVVIAARRRRCFGTAWNQRHFARIRLGHRPHDAVRNMGADEMPWLSIVSDSMNVVGVFAPTVVGLGACLLLEPMAKPASHTEAQQQLDTLAARLRTPDHLLYAGALCLVLGTLQVSAVFSLATATLPTSADVKAKSDLCKTVTVMPEPKKPFHTGSVWHRHHQRWQEQGECAANPS